VVLAGNEPGPLFDALLPLVEGRDAEVKGLFVEDDELLRLAALPFSHELCHLTLSERALEPATIERQFHIQARLARRALETAAGLGRARRSFRSVRGTLAALLRQEVEEVDVMVLGPGRAAFRWARAPAAGADRGRGAAPVVVACTGSAAGRRAVALGAELARAGGRPLELLVIAGDDEADGCVHADVLEDAGLGAGTRRTRVRREAADLVPAARGAGTFVIEAMPEILQALGLRELRQGLACPVLLVR
jgi:hypothetical protein